MSKMNIFKPLIEFRFFILTAIGVLTFSNFIIVLFGQTIPNIVGGFFKEIGVMVIVAAVFVFAFTWLLKAKPHHVPKKYSLVIFDIFGNKANIEGLRTEFKVHDVAWSYMKQYKTSYPLYNFALVSDNKKSDKQTILRYI
jgi:hypothetical protein